MSETGEPQGEGGYTLLELLVVVGLIGIVAALVAANAPSGSGVVKARAAARDIASELRLARGLAIEQNRELDVVLAADGTALTVPGRRGAEMPRGFVASMRPTVGGVPTGSFIRFYPDGSASGARIEIASDSSDVSARVEVYWLTGVVVVGE